MNPKEEAEKRMALRKEHEKRVKEQIDQKLAEIKASFENLPIDQSSIKHIAAEIGQSLLHITQGGFQNDLNFEISQDKYDINRLLITPNNLFTLLIMHGYVVPPSILKGRDSWETDMGTFFFRNGQSSLLPKATAEFITVNIDLNKTD